MRRLLNTSILLAIVAALLLEAAVAASKRPSSSRSAASSHRTSSGPRSSPSRRIIEEDDYEEDDEEEEEEFGFPDDFEDEEEADDYEEEDEEDVRPPPSRRPGPSSQSRRSGPPKKKPSSGSRRKQKTSSGRRPQYDDDYRRPPPRGGRPSGRGSRGSMVPYSRQQPSTLSRGLEALRSSIPDPSTVREAAVSSLNAARETTSNLSSNLYREVKGLTSSELEQVMLKATRPDDTAVKGKHVERLVGVTYQISARYDIYDAVLRKLWSKMAEKDWRTTIKALYILHRFSADGAPEHAPSLKARLRELRRTRDPKRKDKYFNSKQLLAGDNKPETAGYRSFMSRYAHYVLLRAQCFGGMFKEISSIPTPSKDKKDKKRQPAAAKPITSTSLKTEHLDAAALLLKAGIACQLKDGEECENTAIAAERVVSDLIALTAAVAVALNRALKDDLKGADPGVIKKWCEFYSDDLLPKTRCMVKKTSPKLDAYGLFLPSRMGATVSQDLLQKGLKLEENDSAATEEAEDDNTVETKDEATQSADSASNDVEEDEPSKADDDAEEPAAEAADEEGEEFEEYEYEEEEYYDDEEPL